MTAEFLTMVIIMVLLTLFAVIILRSLSENAGVRIRADMKTLLQVYDRIIDQKSAEIQALTAEKERLQQEILNIQTPPPSSVEEVDGESGIIGSASIPPNASYRSSVLGAGYETIREHFQMNAAERSILIEKVATEEEVTHRGRGIIAERLLNSLGFDTVFKLSQLQGEDQLAILDETLSDEDWTLLRDYYEERAHTPFDVIAFWDWLKDIAQMESDALEVFCGDLLASKQEGLVYQQQICEGIQIRTGNRIYDYSIKEREIG